MCSVITNNIFGMNLEEIFRFILLLLETTRKYYNGFIFERNHFHDANEENVSIKNLLISLSDKESDLYEGWYKKNILSQKSEYQPYVSCPNKPIIYLDKEPIKIEFSFFVLPSLIKSFRELVFSSIYKSNKEAGKTGYLLGNAFEDYVFNVLSQIFSDYKISKIDDELQKGGKKSDIVVELQNIILVIEVKLSINSPNQTSTSTSEQVAKGWEKLYKSLKQCVSSIKDIENGNEKRKLIVPIIIIGDNIVVDHLSFNLFCSKSGVYIDNDLKFLEIFSWSQFQRILSRTTIEKFEDAIIKKLSNKDLYEEDIENLIEYNSDKPCHSYEYLESAREVLC